MLIDETGAEALAELISQIEAETDAELVTVLARRADDYTYIPALWAALFALVAPWLLQLSPFWLETREVLIGQAVVFIVSFVLLRWPPLLFRVVPRSVRVGRAAALARRTFLDQGLHHTRDDTGLLIFVSEAEHYVEILADRGIAEHVRPEQWQAIVDEFIVEVRAGRTLDGFRACIDACGELLIEHVPATHAKNELPNHLVLLDP